VKNLNTIIHGQIHIEVFKKFNTLLPTDLNV